MTALFPSAILSGVRLKKGLASLPRNHTPVEVVLVRPPLYLTREEFDLLCAKAVAAGFAPPDFLDRSRRAYARQSVVAELCRRTVLSALLGVRRFKEPTRTRLGSNLPLAAYARQHLIGARFDCLACRSAQLRKRRRGPELRTARRLRDEAVEKAASYRAQNAALREKLRAALAAIEELQGVKKGKAA